MKTFVTGMVSLCLVLGMAAQVVAQRADLVVQIGHDDPVSSVAFSPDGRLLASGSADDMVRLWEVAIEHVRPILDSLETGELARIHAYVRMNGLVREGLDAYCPECDKVYCREHYHVSEEWDEGFYDSSWGTCPEGHRRLIDD